MSEAEVVPHPRAARLDFVEGFMALTQGLPTPEPFRLWSGIACVAGALERRVWVETSQNLIYPNLYVMLVGPPGVGKDQAIGPAADLWNDTKLLRVAPDSVTSASMLDSLIEARRTIVREGRIVAEYHTLLITAPEFGVFCPQYDIEFLSRLNTLYGCPRYLRVRRKYLKDEVNISYPQLTLLSGAQPGFLASLLPDEAWSMGFTSRLIMVYAGSGPSVELFGASEDRSPHRAAMLARMSELTRLSGRFWWERDAAEALAKWHREGGPPKPTHTKLTYYAARRTTLHAPKLAMIASASRGNDMRITGVDVHRALAWLLSAEATMPDIFRDMVGKSDSDVIRELHYFAWRLWMKERKPLHEARLVNFLKDRVPHEKVMKIIEVAERANVITRQAGTKLYVPQAEHQHGLGETSAE